MGPEPRRPLALGIHWAHDAAVAICSPDGLVFALAEERLSRIKHHYGFPIRAVREALSACGLSGADIDVFAFSSTKRFFPQHRNDAIVQQDGRCTLPEPPPGGFVTPSPRVHPAPETLGPQWRGFEDRHWAHHAPELERLGLMDERIRYYCVAHHRAHAASAFRLGGMEEAAVLTIDGKGDGLGATISRGHADGRLELLRTSRAQDSLGSFYQAVTETLGFVPVDGEYKTMGLAALAEAPPDANPFEGLVRVEDGVLHSRMAWEFRDFNAANPALAVPNPITSPRQCEDFKRFLRELSREQLAAHAQAHCEQNVLALARDALRLTGRRRLVAAGGVMLNVKANARIRDELGLAQDDVFVFPDASDSGLAAGAAMEALWQAGAVRAPLRLHSPYLGPAFAPAAIDAAVADWRATGRVLAEPCTPAQLAGHLAGGAVVGSFQGRMEMGPRALGNRSVLADPRDPRVKDRINGMLKGREWFVPFAPAVLADEAPGLWDGGGEHRFMTFAVRASERARRVAPAVVHVDGTMRPQVVTPESNAWLHEVLSAFRARTGVGVLLNTSFNRHGLPIVGSPGDALEHLERGWVDALAIGRWYVRRS